MNGRIFVVIFFFWAVLTIITPTLILLSESAKPDLDSNVEESGGVIHRRMMRYFEKQPRTETASGPMLLASAPAPAPVPEPEPVSGIGEAILTRFLKER